MKNYKKILFFCFYLFLSIYAFSHSGKPKFHVIIDTDGAIDDMRAITMFLAGNDIRVLGIIGSQGTLNAYNSAIKVYSLLDFFHHNGIPVGVGNNVNYALPSWNTMNKNTIWGTIENNDKIYFSNSDSLLNNIIKNYNSKIILIALGSLNTYAEFLKNNPKYINKVSKIIWYNNEIIEKGFNYLIDFSSFNYIKSLNIKLDIVSNNREDELICNEEFLSHISNFDNIYAKQLYKIHFQPSVKEQVSNNHLKLWDDLIPLYLTVPMLFETTNKDNITYVKLQKNIPKNLIYETIGQLLVSANQTNNRSFLTFPIDKDLYNKQTADLLPETINKYGLVEWKAVILTNEVHGHTGIYSIIGVKMGIRACEYFNVGVNNLTATSFAGFAPPLSCLNDGIQTSTGATVGQGLFYLSDKVEKNPTCIFEFNGQKIQITLKEDITQQIENEVAIGVKNYGFSDLYWNYIEELALKYWKDLDRHNIFEIQKVL